jgi:DeoR/GlpR family transcriptional regulator of sugar metabolism
MFTIERQQAIINLLKAEKSLSVAHLSKEFFIGEATIRRDLEKLEKAGLLRRIYGGAVLLEGLNSEIPLSVREMELKEEKNNIAYLACRMVNHGDTIIMDSSSTILKMIPHLKDKDRLTVITNGAKTAVELGGLSNIKVYCTGGVLRENSLSFIGEPAKRFVETFYAETLFFSCRAISMEKGITDSNEDEAGLRRLMMKNSKKVVLLCDHNKFNQISFSKIADFEHIDMLITDQKPVQEWSDLLKGKNVDVVD